MPSSWLQGGVREMTSEVDYWVNTTLNATLVGNGVSGSNGTPIIVSDHSSLTLADLQSLGNTFIGVADTEIVNKNSLWIGAPSNRWDLNFSGQLNLGPLNVDDPISGVVIYEGARGVPSTAKAISVHQFLEKGGGNDVLWGTTGINVPNLWQPLTDSNSTAFRGTLQSTILGLGQWLSNSFKVGFGLVRETGITTPAQSIITLADLGATYCSGASPNSPIKEVNLTTGLERTQSWDQFTFEALDQLRASEAAGGTEIKWSYVGDGLAAGEVIDSVVTYIYTGAFSLATAVILNWDEANYTIVLNEDIKYGSTNTGDQGAVAIITPEIA